jgi:ABC-2 type transport system ATP-binding protein
LGFQGEVHAIARFAYLSIQFTLPVLGESRVPVVETFELRKRYKRVEALKGVSIRVDAGEVFGLLGQNGAGKTTLIKILLGIVKNPEGEAVLFDQKAGTASVLQRVGYLPEDHRFPEYHTGYSLLDYYGTLHGMSSSDRRKRIPDLLERVGITDRMHDKIRGYSKGMKQRVGIAQAILHDPELIFLDEPTDGVDPVGRREIRTIIEERKKAGATVFVNSHLLGEIELMCNRVAVMHRGSLIREGTVQEITRQANTFVIGIADGTFPQEKLAKLGYVCNPRNDRFEVELPEGKSIDPVLQLLSAEGLKLRHLVEKRQSLEDVFVKLVDDERDNEREAGRGSRKPKKRDYE